MTETLVLLTMAVFALLAIHSSQMRMAIVHLAVFSLLAALLYLLYAAPELAIAEGVIGSGIVTLLYLAALKKNRVYTIGIVRPTPTEALVDREIIAVERSRALQEIRNFFVRREIEVQLVFLDQALPAALAGQSYDLILLDEYPQIVAYSDDDDFVFLELEMMFQFHGGDAQIRFERVSRGGIPAEVL